MHALIKTKFADKTHFYLACQQWAMFHNAVHEITHFTLEITLLLQWCSQGKQSSLLVKL